MSDWTIYFRTPDGQDAASRKLENEGSALIHARDLQRQHCEIDRIVGSNGQVKHRAEIVDWIKQNPE